VISANIRSILGNCDSPAAIIAFVTIGSSESGSACAILCHCATIFHGAGGGGISAQQCELPHIPTTTNEVKSFATLIAAITPSGASCDYEVSGISFV